VGSINQTVQNRLHLPPRSERAGRAWRGKEVELCIVAASVQMTYQGRIVRTRPIRHDRTKESTPPGGVAK
jgi:hypothetical protein